MGIYLGMPVSVLWRLRRATSIETAIFDSATENARLLTSAKSSRRMRWPTAIYSFQQCRIFHSTALLAMNPLCGGKLGRLFPHLSRCGGVSASQGALAFPSHFVVRAKVRSPTVTDSGLFLAERQCCVSSCRRRRVAMGAVPGPPPSSKSSALNKSSSLLFKIENSYWLVFCHMKLARPAGGIAP